jgi:hypothetical protein
MDKNSVKIWFKKYILLTKYHLRSFGRRTAYTPIALFLISFILFALILMPSVRQRIREKVKTSSMNTALQVFGTISEEVIIQNGPVTMRPISGAIIEIGGEHTLSNPDGTYKLTIHSPTKQRLPIIFNYGNREVIDRISFPEGRDRVQKDFTFR